MLRKTCLFLSLLRKISLHAAHSIDNSSKLMLFISPSYFSSPLNEFVSLKIEQEIRNATF